MLDIGRFVCELVRFHNACQITSASSLRTDADVGASGTLTADHLDDKPAFRLAERVVEADITALHGGIPVSGFGCFAFENGQEGLKYS